MYLYKGNYQTGDSLLLNGPLTIDFSKRYSDFDGQISSMKVLYTSDFVIRGTWVTYT